jgi:hypothetical protein
LDSETNSADFRSRRWWNEVGLGEGEREFMLSTATGLPPFPKTYHPAFCSDKDAGQLFMSTLESVHQTGQASKAGCSLLVRCTRASNKNTKEK